MSVQRVDAPEMVAAKRLLAEIVEAVRGGDFVLASLCESEMRLQLATAVIEGRGYARSLAQLILDVAAIEWQREWRRAA